jgi:hypothetical protein
MHKINWLRRDGMLPLPHHCLIWDEKTFHAELKRLNVKEYVEPLATKKANSTLHILENSEGETLCIVFCPRKHLLEVSIAQMCGLLTHEATHIWQQYVIEINEKAPCHELEAYCVQRIAQNLIWQALRLRKVQ